MSLKNYQYFPFALLNSFILDDGHTKPAPREDGPPTGKAATTSKKSRTSSSSSSKARLDSTSSDGGPDFMCLIRANYRTEKISTVVREWRLIVLEPFGQVVSPLQVHAKDVNKFQLAYCNLLKSNMDGLKRQKKVKAKKAKE